MIGSRACPGVGRGNRLVRFPSETVRSVSVHAMDKREFSMQISVSVRHGEMQPGDQPLIEEKVEKLRRLFDRVNAIEVVIDMKQLDNPTVELRVSAEHAPDCLASAEATTVLAALDLAIPKIEQQLRRTKEKMTGHRATRHTHIDSTPVPE
jgi:putative sigma-54 modulation protein